MRRTARAGFTLLELMVATTVISILLMVAVGPIVQSRNRGMVSAAKLEMANTLKALAMYETVNGGFPATLSQLEDMGYTHSGSIKVCHYEVIDGLVDLQLQHEGSKTRVLTMYPAWGGEIRELQNRACADISESGAAPDPPGKSGDAPGKSGDAPGLRKKAGK